MAVKLLIRYSFDLGGHSASQLIDHWLKDYSDTWVRLAVIEALYRGRYKAISVKQILNFWQKRGQALYHFNYDFERLICSEFSQEPNFEACTSPPPSPSASRESNQTEKDILPPPVDPSHTTPTTTYPTNKIDEQLPFSGSTQTSHNDPRTLERRNDSHPPIEQFMPSADHSHFYTKLKAISRIKRGQ